MVRRPKQPQDAGALLGSLEYESMRALWRDAPASVKAVRDRINDDRAKSQHLAYTTVMTVLARLHEKGLLDRVKHGRGYQYTPRFDEAALIEHLGRQEVTELVERYGTVALSQFAAALADADPATVQRLRDLAGEEADA